MTSTTLTRTSGPSTAALWAGLALCMAAGPLLLYTLTAISPLVIDDLGLSEAQYGAIAAVTFGAAAVSALVLGGPTGRIGARTVMVAVSLGGAVGLGVLALAGSFAWVVVAAVVSGAAQALSNPATNRVVAALPAHRRGALIGWKQSGVQMAQLLAGVLAPAIAVLAGWRWAAAVGMVIALLAAATSLAIRPERAPQSAAVAEGAGTWTSVATLTAYTFCMGFGLQATNAYLPLFAHRQLGFSVPTAGATAAVIGAVGVASRIVWARAAHRDGLRAHTLTLLALGAALGVGLGLAATVAGGWLVWVGAAIFGAAALASNAVTMVALVRTVPPALLSAATGLLVTGMYVGFATGPLTFGLALESGVAFPAAWLVPLLAFGLAAVIGLPTPLTRPLRDS
ncbi:MFS transporter [Raineyella sp. LH-20]|uniref:MFS transporter n=1 Tax=Raineyella sp. LH-20 TaxID=3081204 RepID=UPI002953BD4B|nr:MFS transporter [Raineyella sp. LH-20]WOP18875.1 MFS transporter [Raineyella sp. LH-20]